MSMDDRKPHYSPILDSLNCKKVKAENTSWLNLKLSNIFKNWGLKSPQITRQPEEEQMIQSPD